MNEWMAQGSLKWYIYSMDWNRKTAFLMVSCQCHINFATLQLWANMINNLVTEH
jgi:hypothetical protein